MKTNNTKESGSKLFKSSIAVMAAIGLPLAGSMAQAQSLESDPYPYRMDLDNAPQLSEPINEFVLGRTVQTQQQGSLQMTIGGSHERDGEGSGSARFSEIRARAEYGVTDRLQLQAELPYQIEDRRGAYDAQTNIGNVQVGAMYSLLRGDDPISLSAALDVQIPTGHQANLQSDMRIGGQMRASDETIWKPSLIVARDFGPTQVHANAQAELGDVNRGLNYDIGAVYPIGPVAPTLELNARTMDNTRPEFYATPGVFYSFSDRTQLGVGVPIGLNDQSTSSAFMAKFSFQFR